MSAPAPRTRVAPARVPDGWWTGHPRYRVYVLFAATGGVLAAAAAVLLAGVRALATGSAAWVAYQAALGSLFVLPLSLLLLVGILFFSLRWLRVGATIPVVRLGPLPAPPLRAIAVAHFAGLLLLSAVILIVLSGVIV